MPELPITHCREDEQAAVVQLVGPRPSRDVSDESCVDLNAAHRGNVERAPRVRIQTRNPQGNRIADALRQEGPAAGSESDLPAIVHHLVRSDQRR